MLEVPLTGEYHGDALLVGLPDRILVADRTAGLHNRRHAVLGGQRHTVVEGLFISCFSHIKFSFLLILKYNLMPF